MTRQEAERLAALIDWDRVRPTPPPQTWFDDDDNPFEPEQEPAPGAMLSRPSRGVSDAP